MLNQKAGDIKNQGPLHMLGGAFYAPCKAEKGALCQYGLHRETLIDMQHKF